jgi:hypothetical protein
MFCVVKGVRAEAQGRCIAIASRRCPGDWTLCPRNLHLASRGPILVRVCASGIASSERKEHPLLLAMTDPAMSKRAQFLA